MPHADRCARFTAWRGPPPPIPPPDAAQIRAAKASAAVKLRLPPGITPVPHEPWTDRCAVCGAIEEWEDNCFVQCDGCGLMAHQACYGVPDSSLPENGGAWVCRVCELGLPAPPPCCLCPVSGGALKPTDDGRWAHLFCAMWIPETIFGDPSALEPVGNLAGIAKPRFGLRCGLCKQPHGACIQCAGDAKCYAAYHPLCARRAGLAMEITALPESGGAPGRPRDKAVSSAVVEGAGVVRMASYCAKHRPVAAAGSTGAWRSPPKGAGKRGGGVAKPRLAPTCAPAAAPVPTCSAPPVPPESLMVPAGRGCARTEPFDAAGRRDRRAPAAAAAAAAKRSFVRATPYIVSGARGDPAMAPPSRQRVYWPPGPAPAPAPVPKKSRAPQPVAVMTWGAGSLSPEHTAVVAAPGATALPGSRGPPRPQTLGERYAAMGASLGRRLAAGKSSIHGLGVFAQVPAKAGEFLLEYVGETVRGTVADVRERRLYDQLVGAGTYVFRLDGETCVDATRAGNMAHLINHACSPNCYSRTVVLGGSSHILIVALSDLPAGAELTYDYRFASATERLPCNCGCPGCRRVVNLPEAATAPDPPLPEGVLLALRAELTATGSIPGGGAPVARGLLVCDDDDDSAGAGAGAAPTTTAAKRRAPVGGRPTEVEAKRTRPPSSRTAARAAAGRRGATAMAAVAAAATATNAPA